MPHKIENAPGHSAQSEDFYPNVKVVYLPPHTMALFHPINLGVIASFKAYYLRRTIAMALQATTLRISCLYSSITTELLPSTSAASTIPASPPSY